ncbi:helix-turn-helix domain-containing protein [Hoeflea poritis]|uniref:Helix-turn-helix transcriptional regulator n=1 Tax=Hoeflea poritis TaxID=2993659 RepID=A0ABT4VPM2_9HYPH|nr:helix-turn-helix transcriptional regulator [Hoeflea poritis]MDA4845963.1 helix-turn-helix transcriptional regulator [Hoeflea poritis]
MNTMNERLKFARRNAGFRFAKTAAERMGMKTTTYFSHENGQNKFDRSWANRYAEAFGCDPVWLLTGKGEPPTPGENDMNDAPITDTDANAGGIDFELMEQAIRAADLTITGYGGEVSLEKRDRLIKLHYANLLKLRSLNVVVNG